MVVICCMNLVTILLALALLSREVTLAGVITTLGRDLGLVYRWALDNLVSLWQSLVS